MGQRRSRLGAISGLKTTRDRSAFTLELDHGDSGRTETVTAIAAERALGDIGWRVGRDTRPLNPRHVAKLASSVAALGLLEPLVVDANDHLLAGAHRLAACSVLAAPRDERITRLEELCPEMSLAASTRRLVTALPADAGEFDTERVPVRVVDFDARNDLDRALAIEAAENAQRRNYTPDEVRALYNRLIEAGFTDRPGRPRKGERPARPVIAAVIGRTNRQVRNILNRARRRARDEKTGRASGLRALKRLRNAIRAEASELDALTDATLADLSGRD